MLLALFVLSALGCRAVSVTDYDDREPALVMEQFFSSDLPPWHDEGLVRPRHPHLQCQHRGLLA